MDPARFAEVKRLLLSARELPAEARERHVREAAGDDETLAEEILSLLRQEESPARIVEEGVLPRQLDLATRHPERIGPYHVAGVLGEGGMGVVYRAVQEEPIRREVALKLVRHGRDSASTLRRFRYERQSLARMDHPHIASVLDAGATEDGRPWFVMPLVQGRPITTFCDEERLTVDERLRLFVDVCRAVQHAHQRGLLHRDLKPSNILVRRVDGRAVPMVIDFGIARALGDDSEDLTSGLTLEGQRIGTPAYMSPEQLRGDDANVDSRADVYALGVMLYELLAGRHPWADTNERAPTDVSTTVAPPPSHAFERSDPKTRAHERSTNARELQRHLRGDLDTICLMAVRSEPERRYASAAHLADDIERFLRREPVLARPDGWRYRAGKFVRRNPALTATAALILTLVLTTSGLLAWHAGRMENERNRALAAEARAQREAGAAQSIATFLEELFTSAEPGGERARGDLSARELLDQGVRRVPLELADEPYLQARMYRALGRTYHALSLPAEAESLYVLGLDRLDADPDLEADRQAEERARFHGLLAVSYHDMARFGEAVHHDSIAVDLYRRLRGGDDFDLAAALSQLGISTQARGDVERGLEYVRQSLEMHERLGTPPDAELAWNWGTLGYLSYQLGRLDDSRRYMEKALRLAREVFGGKDDFDLLYAVNNHGGLLEALDDLDGAEPLLREALEMCQRMYARSEHAALGRAYVNYGKVALRRGDLDSARRDFDRGHEILLRTAGEDHPLTANALFFRGELARAAGESAVAESLHTRALALREAVYGPDGHASIASSEYALGRTFLDEGDVERAAPHLLANLESTRARLPEGHWERSRAAFWWGLVRVRQGETEAGLAAMESALRELESQLGPEHRECREARAGFEEIRASRAGR